MGRRLGRRTPVRLATAAIGAALLLPLAQPAGAAPSTRPAGRYTNPVLSSIADTFADPSIIRGKDGYWYAYGTSDPLKEGEKTPHYLPIVRTKDFVTWTSVGDAFTAATLPSWADTAPGLGIWAPDIRYVDGQYRLYYVVTQTTVTGERDDNAVGMATAPTPAGPWTDSGAPVVAPRNNGGPGNYLWTFDPSVVTDTDGSQHIIYGSYYGGIYSAPLDRSGKTVTGPATQIAIDNKFEGGYLVHRDGYWYLFASTANCCAGPTTGYSVQVGRSRSVNGPFVDKQGIPLTTSRAGGTPVLYQNGNRWIGTGHNAVFTDLKGQDFVAYHAIDQADPFLDEVGGVNERPLLVDRLDWVGGWPVVNGDKGPTETPQKPPTTVGNGVTTVDGGLTRWRGATGWTVANDPDAGAYAVSQGAGSLLFPTGRAEARVQADVRGANSTLTVRADTGATPWQVNARLELSSRQIVLELVRNGTTSRSSVRLPANFVASAWHTFVLQTRNNRVYAEISNAGLNDPLATISAGLTLPTGSGAYSGGVVAPGKGAQVDNLSALPLTKPAVKPAAEQKLGTLDPARSDEFSGGDIGAGWTKQGNVGATVSGGALQWPTEAGDLVGPGNNGSSLLLRDAPSASTWAVETKLTNDFGVDDVRNFQQGGIVVYVNDDEFLRLSNVAIWNTRQVEFGIEKSFAGKLFYGGTIIGPPGETTWLRVARRVVGSQQLFTGYSSNDGSTWVKGGTWTLPTSDTVRVGLLSQGGAGGNVAFDYFRAYH